MKNSDSPAYAAMAGAQDEILNAFDYERSTSGLTKREAFAMAAMQGMLSNGVTITALHDECLEYVKQRAYFQADLMLEELDSEQI